MAMKPNKERYLASIADELYSQSTRVRDLIGGVHWLSDGRHKEYLLTELIKRHLPSGCLAAPGFVVRPGDVSGCSREQDLLVVDTSVEGPLFHQGNLIIAFPSTVLAAISVKTNAEEKYVREAVQGLNSVRDVSADTNPQREPIWCGAFFFEEREYALKDPTTILNHIEKAMNDFPVAAAAHASVHLPGPDYIATAYDLLVRFDYHGDNAAITSARLLPHNCGGLAAAIMIAQLTNHIAQARGIAHSDFGHLADVPKPLIKPSSIREIVFAS
jgi:hypothetical protein